MIVAATRFDFTDGHAELTPRPGVPSSCATMSRLLEQFPSSPEAARYRPVHVVHCQSRPR